MQPARSERPERPTTTFTSSPIFRWFRRLSALVRWGILILAVGLGTAALIALALGALVTLVDNSL